MCSNGARAHERGGFCVCALLSGSYSSELKEGAEKRDGGRAEIEKVSGCVTGGGRGGGGGGGGV